MADRYANFPPYTVGPLTGDTTQGLAIWKDGEILRDMKLTPMCIRILIRLIERRGTTVRAPEVPELSDYRNDVARQAEYFTKYISRLKMCLGDESRVYINPVHKKRDPENVGGYRFVGDVEFSDAPANERSGIIDAPVPTSETTSEHDTRVSLTPLASSASEDDSLESGTDSSRLFAETFNAGGRRIIGSVIETHAHPNLESGLPLSEIGWSENEVSLRLMPGLFGTETVLSDPIVDRAFAECEADNHRHGRPSILMPPDGSKYAVVDATSPFLDVNDFSVTVQETRYFSIMRARPAVESIFALRKKFGHAEPHKNRIPHALGLQFVALFADGQVLAIQRAKDTFPFPGTWSFSGEEQCASIDLSWDERDRMKNYTLRTIVEEVFPLARIAHPARLKPVMEEVQRYVADRRIIGLLLEEPIVTFSFFVIFRLNIKAKEYSEEVRNLVRNGRGQMSREGLYFSVSFPDLPLLLSGRGVQARPLFGVHEESIAPGNLHPTSLYRLTRLLEVMGLRN